MRRRRKPQKKQKDNEKTVKMLMFNPLSRKITYKVVSNFAKIELMSGVTTIRTVGGREIRFFSMFLM